MGLSAAVLEDPAADQFPDRIARVGLEVECFLMEAEQSEVSIGGTKFARDAGVDLGEIITSPHATCGKATASMDEVCRLSAMQPIFTPFRPAHLLHNRGKWRPDLRYDALLKAVSAESPRHGHLVNKMTDHAATHVNVSGSFDPVGQDGVFIMNMVNAIAPYFAHQVHDQLGVGYGHLAIWKRFADARRFPQYGRWIASPEALRAHFESLPKLLLRRGDGVYVPNPGPNQVWGCVADHGVMWWFARPKVTDDGNWYLELRFLPSMPLNAVDYYGGLVVEMVEWLLEWFHDHNQSRPVATQQDAHKAFRFLSGKLPEFVPPAPLTQRQWARALLS